MISIPFGAAIMNTLAATSGEQAVRQFIDFYLLILSVFSKNPSLRSE